MGGWLGIDYGERRVGIAVASVDERRPEPLITLTNDETLVATLQRLCAEHRVSTIVLGLPRGLDGQETRQTQVVRAFATTLSSSLALPIELQDEAVTSELAKERLEQRGASLRYGAIDREAAAIILGDHLGVDA